ncbi:hypothetical protein [Bradyrhizobium sp. CCGE-LA001]|uniref:hypothetical protein n=1 Tax=Bradyrhizobium sp. CCGE-LA001 TaxID=1223566 RepID=UPI00031117E7|nr:hypothetical protein [Bradyrhizobium sp. CCGE-LA001]
MEQKSRTEQSAGRITCAREDAISPRRPHVAEAVLNHLPSRLVRTYDTNAYFKESARPWTCGQRT